MKLQAQVSTIVTEIYEGVQLAVGAGIYVEGPRNIEIVLATDDKGSTAKFTIFAQDERQIRHLKEMRKRAAEEAGK